MPRPLLIRKWCRGDLTQGSDAQVLVLSPTLGDILKRPYIYAGLNGHYKRLPSRGVWGGQGPVCPSFLGTLLVLALKPHTLENFSVLSEMGWWVTLLGVRAVSVPAGHTSLVKES